MKNFVKTKKYKKKYKKHRKTVKIKSTPIIISSSTPYNEQKIGDLINKQKSFSPFINKKLVPKTQNFYKSNLLKCIRFKNINEKLPKISVNNKCLPYFDNSSQKALLHNLALSYEFIKWKDVRAPVQKQSNCWFNTMFMNFFVSDKGRKFFKFFRQLMIEGKQSNNKDIHPPELRNIFAYLNLAIEASLLGDDLILTLDTNEFISKIYKTIPSNYKHMGIVKSGKANNPLFFYSGLINYLNNKDLQLLVINLNETNSIFKRFYTFPDVLVIEINDYEDDNLSKKTDNKKLILELSNYMDKKAKYKLDSVIIRDTQKIHFCSLLTINNKDFGFDGISFRRLTPFKWRHLINKNKKWTFEGSLWDNSTESITWNFRNGYQLLFYYRI